MKKLNNHGWGLGMLLVFIVIFLLAILIITIQANKLGIAGHEQFYTPHPTIEEDVDSTETENRQEYTSYALLESAVKESAAVYREKYYASIPKGDSIRVDFTHLIEDGLLKEPYVNGVHCDGYVIISHEENYAYHVFYQCGDEQSKDF